MKQRGLSRRKVIGTTHLKTGRGVGRQKVWAYVIEDLADLFGMSVEATRKAIQREKFDPSDLRSIFNFAAGHRQSDEAPEPEPEQLPAPKKLLSG